jgi:hypothetical protein
MSERAIAPAAKAPVSVLSQSPAGALQRTCACGQHTMGGECEGCKKKTLTIQRRAIDGRTPPPTPPIVYDVLHSSGQALDAETRAFMEPRFGRDFSGVRVHTDAMAASSAQQLHSLAFTVGEEIVFGSGQYAPKNRFGRGLLAHELAHVVQTQSTSSKMGMALAIQPDDAAERQADSVGRQVAMGLPLRDWNPATPPSVLNLAPETWFRGEVEGLASAKDGGVVHDLGDGTYFSDRMDVAKQYAELRSPTDPAAARVLTGQVDPKSLGRVLDLTEEADFMKDFNFVKTRLGKVSGEPYRNLVENFLTKKGIKLEDFEVVVGPEDIRGGKQMRIRSPQLAAQVRASFAPVKIAGRGGRGPGSTGGGGEGGGEEGGGRGPGPRRGGSSGGVQGAGAEGEVETEQGTSRRARQVPGATESEGGPGIPGRQVAASMALNIGAGIALGIFQSEFKEKMRRDLAALPRPKIDKRGAAEFLKDSSVKGSMGLLDLFSKNFIPLGQELSTNQQALIGRVNLKLVGVALTSGKTSADAERKLRLLDDIANELHEYEELLLTIRDNLEAILEMEEKALSTKKAADDLRDLLKSGLVIDWLFHEGFTVEEISSMDSNLLHLSVSIDMAFRDAHSLKDTVDKLLEDEFGWARVVNKIWWNEFAAELQLLLKERQKQRDDATAAQKQQAQKQTAEARPRERGPVFRNADEMGTYYGLRTKEGELLFQLEQLEKKVATLRPGTQSQDLKEQRDDLLEQLKSVRERLKQYRVTTAP